MYDICILNIEPKLKITTPSISISNKRDVYLAEKYVNSESTITYSNLEEEETTSSLSDYFIAVCMVGNGVDIPKVATIKCISSINELSYRLASHIVDVDHVGWSWSPLFRQLIH